MKQLKEAQKGVSRYEKLLKKARAREEEYARAGDPENAENSGVEPDLSEAFLDGLSWGRAIERSRGSR